MSLDDGDYDDALQAILSAHGVGAPTPVATASNPPGSDAESSLPDSPPQLIAVGHLRGVGKVRPDEEMRFAPEGLNVVYGPNAVGKSTYVAALKRICRTVDHARTVQGDVFAEVSDPPSAQIEYQVGGVTRAQRVDLESKDFTALGAVSVFDARCAELYLDAKNAVAYVPSSALLLARLASTQDRMRKDIDARIAHLNAAGPSFAEFADAPKVAAYLQNLSAGTDVGHVRGYAQLSSDEDARLRELTAALAVADAHNAQANAQAATQTANDARQLASDLTDITGRVDTAGCQRLTAQATSARAARHAADTAAQELAQHGPPSVGQDPWRRMWEAARAFVEADHGVFPPAVGRLCPLCLQALGDAAAERLSHFERHVQSTLEREAAAAEAALATAIRDYDPAQVTALRDHFLPRLRATSPEVSAVVDATTQQLADWFCRVTGNPIEATPPTFHLPTAALLDLAADYDARATLLHAADHPDHGQILRQEARELTGRLALAGRLDQITTWVATLQDIGQLQVAHSALATNKITTKQRELSERAVTETLAAALKHELSELRCTHLPINPEPHTAIGATHVGLRLIGARDTRRVSDILSEGEQRALSLAFFFAEISVVSHRAGIIIDDPVSSLDDERRSYIASRLVCESAKRQVIVFTHDLPFMLDIIDEADAHGMQPNVQAIWRHGDTVGRIDGHPPFTALKFRQRVAVLSDRVQEWEKQPVPRNADEAWHRVCGFYSDMRATWERAIEERLFNGVVQRFQRDVKTLRLAGVAITPERVDQVSHGMTRCSQFMHDAPAGTRTVIPGRTELSNDLDKLRAFETATRSA